MKYRNVRLFLLLIICITGCKSPVSQEASETGRKKYEIEKNPVDTLMLRKKDFHSQLLSNGKLRARNKSVLKFATTGIVRQLNVKNGSAVAAGEIIAVLDTCEAALQWEQALNQMDKASIELEDKLLGYGYNIRDSLQVPPETMRIARIHSGYNDALAHLQTARLQLDQCTLRAPVGGKIANLHTHLHEYPEGNEFCEIINDRTFEVEFTILENELKTIYTGQKVLVATFTNPDKKYPGYITEINPTVDENGQIKVIAQFPNPGHLLDGMNVKIQVESIIPGQFVVPKSAVLIRDNQEVLFRINEEGKADWTYVHIVRTNSDSYVVTANREKRVELKEGDIIITSGNLNLAHESLVEIKK